MLVSSVDYVARRIYLSIATVNTDIDTLLIYKEVRTIRRQTPEHQQFKPMIIAGGNVTKIPGQSYTPIYVTLLYGCRIVPYNQQHKLRLIRDTFTDDGSAGRDCFDRTTLTHAVDIDVDFPEVEVREVIVGGSSGPTASSIVAALLAQAQITPIHSDMRKAVGQDYHGDGSEGNKLRSTLVP